MLANKSNYQSVSISLGLQVFILPITLFIPGFILTSVIAYFYYLNSWQLWISSIILSLIIFITLNFFVKNWLNSFIKYLKSASIAGFGLLLIFLFGLKSNFLIVEINRLFKNDTGLELISKSKFPNYDLIELYIPNVKTFNHLPPSERKLWMNILQRYVNSKYNEEGKLVFKTNLNNYLKQKKYLIDWAVNSILVEDYNKTYFENLLNQSISTLKKKQSLIRKADLYFQRKKVFTNYKDLLIFYCFFRLEL